MIQLRLTKKVQDEVGINKKDLCEIRESDHVLGNWYVNLFWYYRRKHLVFMNEKTLYSFPVLGVKKSELNNIEKMFYAELANALDRDGYSVSEIDWVIENIGNIELTKTNSPNLLGNLMDLIDRNRWYMDDYFTFENCNLNEMQKRNNYMPQNTLGWSFSGELVRELITKKGSVA